MADTNTVNNTDIPDTPAEAAASLPTSSPRELVLISSMPTSTSAAPFTSVNKTVVSEPAVSVVNDHGIVNLSNYALSTTEKQLLSKGLSFCPSPGECNLSNAKFAVDKLHRSLRLAHFFNENDAFPEASDDEGFSHRNFRPRSTWNPPGYPPPTLASFITANNSALSDLPTLTSDFHNLNPSERTALKNLASNRQIIIKPADKGSNVVILNTNDYIHEAFRQLSDTNFYQTLDTDLTPKINTDISQTLLTMRNNKEIDKKCLAYLLPSNPRPGRFYLLPKIHKGVLPPPGRPIVSAIGSPTEKISEFLDFFLQPSLSSIPSYVKDTGHFLYILQNLGPFPEDTLLVTYDVASLYTNIPLTEAERSVARMLIQSRPHNATPSNQSLLKLLRHVFQGNIFTFSDGDKLHHYLQINGVSMGSKCAPSVACVFMGDFERQHLSNPSNNQPQPLIWLRYIDDIFAIWSHGKDSLLQFNAWLNSRHPKIQFTCIYSKLSVDFLDTTVKLIDGSLQTELYIKPTSSLSYLHRDSSHPTHVFQALPYGEFLRVRRNCSTISSFNRFSDIILEAFVQRGYDRVSLLRAQEQARSVERHSLLEPYANLQVSHRTDADNLNGPPDQFFFILEHHRSNPKIHQILRRNWTILGTSDTTSDLYQSDLTCGASRNPRLRDILVRSSIPLKPTFGKKGKSTNVCHIAQCKYCVNIDTSGQIKSKKLRRNFPAKFQVCCKSHNLVYCLTCKICGLQYVGQTKRTFHERLYEHFRDIQNKDPTKPLGRHFALPNHTPDTKLVTSHILAFITKPSNTSAAQQMRLKIEREWIFRLRTNLPHGLNAMD